MKNKIFLFMTGMIMLVALCVQGQIPQNLREQREYTIKRFAEVTCGTPISIPLIFESDPSWSLLIVSNDSTDLKVDRIFLVEAKKEFIFEKDIYKLDSVLVINQGTGCIFNAKVSGLKNEIVREVELDGYQMHLIQKINKNEWEYKSAIIIPIIKNNQKQ